MDVLPWYHKKRRNSNNSSKNRSFSLNPLLPHHQRNQTYVRQMQSQSHIIIKCPKFIVACKVLKNSSLHEALNEENTKAIYTFLRKIIKIQ